ncbi:hypothetical protein [Microbacterium sp. 22296]|uniref:hypothetical protein n=1 Tax=Microbacterium sp. 22296 TaxID=3453903 RepID=UPI003F842D23
MRDGYKKILAASFSMLSAGFFEPSHAVALFIVLREEAPRGSLLRDLGDMMAHDDRDRGPAFEYIGSFASGLSEYVRTGRKPAGPAVEVLYEIHAVIDEVCDAADSVGVTHDRATIHAASDILANALGYALDGTSLKVDGGRVMAQLWFGGQTDEVALHPVNPMPGPISTWMPDTSIALPLFRGFSGG